MKKLYLTIILCCLSNCSFVEAFQPHKFWSPMYGNIVCQEVVKNMGVIYELRNCTSDNLLFQGKLLTFENPTNFLKEEN